MKDLLPSVAPQEPSPLPGNKSHIRECRYPAGKGVVPPGMTRRDLEGGVWALEISVNRRYLWLLKGAVLQRGDGLSMPLSPDLGHILYLPKLQAVSGTGGYAGRIQALIDAVLAVITLDHLARFRVPLGGAPGTGGNAGFASHAQVLIDKDDPVAGALLHGTGGASRHTPGIFTMKTGHEDVSGPRKTTDHFGSDLDDFAQLGAEGQIFVGFALYFTGMATDTLFGVLKQIIFAHSPLVLLDDPRS